MTKMTDEDFDALETKAREVKRRADSIMATDAYAISYTLVADDLAQVGEEMPWISDAALALSAEVRRLRAKLDDAFGEVAAGLERERVMRSQLTMVATDSTDVWRWQGDGYDYPESLSCPVVMSADRLRSFVIAEQERDLLRAQTTPSPAGTVRLRYPDGSHRDVDPNGYVPVVVLGSVSKRSYGDICWTSWRQRGVDLSIPVDWDAADGSECSAWATVRVETYAEEVARERAARTEAERQRDDAQATAEQEIAGWLGGLVKAVDPGQPGAREVTAELRRRAAEVRTWAWRSPKEKS